MLTVMTPADMDRWNRVDQLGFGFTPTDDSAAVQPIVEHDRTLIATIDGVDVGVAGVLTQQLSLPGVGPRQVAGVSTVAVVPTHRRRGVARALLRRLLEDVRARREEPIAVLWASDPGIYGRYGFGLAVRRVSVVVPRDRSAMLPSAAPGLTTEVLEPADAAADLRRVEAALAEIRPGIPVRDERWWARTLHDAPGERGGGSAMRAFVIRDGSEPRAYALARTVMKWDGTVARGQVVVRETAALDVEAEQTLWGVLTGYDLMGEVNAWNLPVDDPLLWRLDDPRAAAPSLADALHVCVIDVPFALESRRYRGPVEVVLEVDDPFLDRGGRFRLVGDAAGARCEPTDDSPDLRLGLSELSAAYLGGTALEELALAGRVEELTPGALAPAAYAFSWHPKPWTPYVF